MLLRSAGRATAEAETLIQALSTGKYQELVQPRDRVMLDYALKLTHTPAVMAASDVDALREAGFDDRAIHDICAITAYYAFVNRIADGLGVEIES